MRGVACGIMSQAPLSMNRTRWYCDIAGVFLLWVEEVVPADPNRAPWQGRVLRRGGPVRVEIPEGPPLRSRGLTWDDPFPARSKAAAIDAAENTIRNYFPDYANRVKDPKWIESHVSDEDWETACSGFKEDKDFELP